MRSRLALACALVAVPVSALAASPTWAQADRRAPIVSAVDPAGDVAIRDVAGPTEAQRRNADLLGFKVSRRDDNVRFTFRIARISTSTEFDQMLTVVFVDDEPGLPQVSGQATLRVQHTRTARSDATVDDEDGSSETGCFGYPFVVNRSRGTVKLFLDLHCLPPGALGIRVKSFTTSPKGQRRTHYSRDFLRVPGSHDLGGLAGTEHLR